jgi:hypothetical protein
MSQSSESNKNGNGSAEASEASSASEAEIWSTSIDDIDEDILEKYPGVNKRKESIREDVYYGKQLIVDKKYKSVDISINKNDCLVAAFLTDVSLNFRKLTQKEKDAYADTWRRQFFVTAFDEETEEDARNEVLGGGFLGEPHIRKLIDIFHVNIMMFERSGAGIRATINLGGLDNMLEGEPVYLMYNPGDGHFRGVREMPANRYLFDTDDAETIMAVHGLDVAPAAAPECEYKEGDEVIHEGQIKVVIHPIYPEKFSGQVVRCVGVQLVAGGPVIPLNKIQRATPEAKAALAAAAAAAAEAAKPSVSSTAAALPPLPPPPPPAAAKKVTIVSKPKAVPSPAPSVTVVPKKEEPVVVVSKPPPLTSPSAALSAPLSAASSLPLPPPPPPRPSLPEYALGASKEAILKQWEDEKTFGNRNVIIQKMKEDRIFPEAEQTTLENKVGLYPDVQDPNFVTKVLGKREFAESKQPSIRQQVAEGVNPCDPEQEFEITPVQRFVSRFLSPYTPYQSALLYHGVGVGKTCAAITIAEGYLEKYPRDQVYIVAPPNIQPGFERTIFDFDGLQIGKGIGDSEANSEINVAKGCTGNTYLKLSGTLFEQDKKTIESRVKALIRRRYKLMGYTQFANEIEGVENRIPRKAGSADLVNQEIKKAYNGKVIIIDEAHNLRDIPDEGEEDNVDVAGGLGELSDAAAGKKLTPFLRRILTVAEGITLVLLTGTPMYNSYSEIIFLMNLLLLNEKRASELLTKEKIFESNGQFKPGGRARLGEITGRYVSFMRGENPLTFPVRLKPEASRSLPLLTSWPNKAPNGKPIEPEGTEPSVSEIQRANRFELPIVQAYFQGDNAEAYKEYTLRIASLGLGIQNANSLVQAGNWIFPGEEDEPIDSRIRNDGFDNQFEARMEARQLVFRSRNGKPEWLAESRLGEVSPKTQILVKRLRTCQGCAFVYSRFVKSGALAIALALEANGYTPWGRDKGFLGDGIIAPGGLQCARCPKKRDEHAGATHKFLPAKYVLLTGSEEYSPNNPGAVAAERRVDNMYGEQIKVVVGSQVVSEGIDLRFIREIYVFDSWFHLNKLEQVVGRGIRTCSHALIPDPRLRNCTVYLLTNAFEPDADGSTMETMDLYTYRRAIRKAVEVGRVTRVLKEYAIDCNLNHDAILVTGLAKVPMLDAQGNPREADRNDTPFTALCDWEECDSYRCIPEVPVNPEKASEKTYTEYAAKWQEQKLLDRVRILFQGKAGEAEQSFVTIADFLEYFGDISRKSLSMLLQIILKTKSFYITLFGKKGRIIYKNGYFLFQPIELQDESIPLALRIAPYPVKRDSYEPEALEAVPVAPKPVVKVAVKKEDEAPVEEPGEVTNDFWNAIEEWSATIRRKEGLEWTDVTAKREKSEVNIPPAVATALNLFHSRDEKLFRRSSERLGMITWFYMSVKENDAYRNLLADILEEIVWDEFLSPTDQMVLMNAWKTNSEKMSQYNHIYKDHWLSSGGTSAFRFVDLRTGSLRYICGEGECTEIQQSVLDESESNKLKTVVVNVSNTGFLYGFLVPKKGELIFKNVNPPGVGAKVEKGQECSISSQVSDHMRKLKELGTAIESERKGTDLGLNEETLAGTRKFENAVRACFLMDIVLRFMDKEAISRKRWMYKSIPSKIAGHKGTFEKGMAT